ncbi:MAG: ribonuclease HII [Thermoprotei archaeon]|nr:MAG: ribonuclease HII [Thermoprotei archaeon]
MEAGIDEAGRGPVIGPMVVACVVLKPEVARALQRLVKDSKLLSPQARRRIYRAICAVAEEVRIRVVEPREIDAAVEGRGDRNLNYLEARVAAELINSLRTEVDTVYVDSPDPLPERFAGLIKLHLRGELQGLKLVAANHADRLYPHVAAASIVAKVERDRVVEELRRLYGDFGSGYPSDPKTRRFLHELLREGRPLPPIVRRSWATLKKLSSGT